MRENLSHSEDLCPSPKGGIDFSQKGDAALTVAEAREIVRDFPKAYRAAFIEAPGVPLRDHPQARVSLHGKVGGATDELRARKESLVKMGYKVTFGSLGKRLLLLERGPSEVCIGVEARPSAKQHLGGKSL